MIGPLKQLNAETYKIAPRNSRRSFLGIKVAVRSVLARVFGWIQETSVGELDRAQCAQPWRGNYPRTKTELRELLVDCFKSQWRSCRTNNIHHNCVASI